MAVDREKSFWLSYSDLMTSLFFIMLVLFIICVPIIYKQKQEIQIITATLDGSEISIIEMRDSLEILRQQTQDLTEELGKTKATAEQYQSILQLEEQFKILSGSSTLRYDETHKTFVAKELEGIEIFTSLSDKIKPEYYNTIDRVGRDLEKILSNLNQNKNYSFLLVIEGNAANTYNHTIPVDNTSTYRLSYDRSLALYNRWRSIGIDLRKYNTEIQICGSGLNGINRDTKIEENNKRFVIQIIPKVSNPNNK